MVEFQFQQFYLKEISIIQNNQLINLKKNLKDSIKMFQFKIIKLSRFSKKYNLIKEKAMQSRLNKAIKM
jgi:hypothetical protein